MQLIRTALLLALGIAAAAPVAVVSAPPASAESHRHTIAPVAAISADSVVDSYGVGVHLNFLNTPYADADAVASALADLGVRHVRDDLFLGAPRQYAAIRTVAHQGIDFDLIMGAPGGGPTPEDYVDTVATELPHGAIASLEGVNEWDLKGGADWVTEMKSWQQELYTAARANPATADLPVLSPALAFRQDYAAVGDLSPYADLANAHMYPGGHRPSNQISQITDALRSAIPTKPVVTTEAGYHNATGTSNGHLPVPEDVAGVYLPRLLLEHVKRGEQRVYSYELIDEFEDPDLNNPEANFGLLRHDLTPKPAYTAMRNLLRLVDDPGPAISPGSLGVEAVGGLGSDARYLLTQRRDGTFVLLLWRDVSVFDPVAQQPLVVSPEDVTLRLDDAADLAVHRPSDGAAPVSETTGTALALELDGQVTAVTIDPVQSVPAPAPADVTAQRGNRSAIVRWTLPPSAAAVTGFEVTRLPDGASYVVPGTDRSYRDADLVNGDRYTYQVRTLTEDGSSPGVVSPTVVPAAIPTAPAIESASAGRRAVTVSWAPSRSRGSAVTGYRLSALGRVLTVGPRRRTATLTGLPAGTRLRVGVRALSDVGVSRAAHSRYVTTRGSPS